VRADVSLRIIDAPAIANSRKMLALTRVVFTLVYASEMRTKRFFGVSSNGVRGNYLNSWVW
jgi:hypothetical protein